MPALSRNGPTLLRTAGAAALVACFLFLALRHVYGQDATYDERFYFGVGRTLLQQGTWDGVMLLHPPLSYYVSSLPLLGAAEVSARDPRQLLLCRLATLLVFGVPLLLTVRAWAQRLYGKDAGLFALALAAFSPTLLAHAPLITPDVPLAATGLLALYVYWRCGADGRVWPWAIALGVALLTKVSAVLFAAAIVALELARVRAQPRRVLRRLALAAGISWLVLCAGYGFAGFFDRRGKAEMLAKVPAVPALQVAAHVAAPFFPLPYLRCIGRQAHVGAEGRPSYLMGEVSARGWPYYYLVALGLKETLPFLLLLAIAFASLRLVPFSWRDEPALLLPPLLFFVVFSLASVQIGVRYVLPALPFLFVFGARVVRAPFPALRFVKPALLGLLACHALATVRGGPDYLAYFNSLAGGPAGGWRYLGDSNLDWGQNRSRAEEYARRTGAAFEPLRLPDHGLVVLSTNRVQGFMDPPRYRLLRDEYAPSDRVGWNWFVYDLDRDRLFAAESMVPVLSGPEWRAGAAAGDWSAPGFDARSWSRAAEAGDDGLPLRDNFPGTAARIMTCAGGAADCAFRRTFDLRAPPARAIAYFATRGEYEIFANGRRVAAREGCAAGFRRESLRLTEQLHAGVNVIGLRAGRCGDAAPRVFFEMRLPQP